MQVTVDSGHQVNPFLGFLATVTLTIIGVVIGEIHIAQFVKDFLQCGAWFTAIFVGMGSAFGLNYKLLVKHFIAFLKKQWRS
jgi:hypothetical protein